MHTVQDQPTIVRSLTPSAVLLRAADGLRTGAIDWGRGYFITPDSCRCTGGVIAWAADPSDIDGDPRYIRAARDAMRLLAAHLMDTHQVECVVTEGFVDPVETVGAWNDAPGMTVERVIAQLEGAAA